MNLIKFIDELLKPGYLKNKRVLVFYGDSKYPFLFISQIFSFLSQKSLLPVEYKSLITDSNGRENLRGELLQSFLGQKNFYWLGNCSARSKKDKEGKKFIDFLLQYPGPNYLSFYSKDEDLLKKVKSKSTDKVNFVELPEVINLKLFEKLKSFFGITISSKKKDLVKKVFEQSNGLSLDQSIMLIRYLDFVKVNKETQFLSYVSSVFVHDSPSLNLMTQYFFEKKSRQFFKIWSKIEGDYSNVFWITFWSDKIFRAYFAIDFLKKNKIPQARSIGFRLPFSFLKSGWKKFSMEELSKYSDFLYECDFLTKVGSNFCSLELFYLKHFCNGF